MNEIKEKYKILQPSKTLQPNEKAELRRSEIDQFVAMAF